jgi:LysR family transcriptional activator of nhaA
VHELDMVLSDTPVPPTVLVKAYSHLLGESGTTFFAAPALAARVSRRFPEALAGTPMLLPGDGTVLRRHSRTGSSTRGSGQTSSASSTTAR